MPEEGQDERSLQGPGVLEGQRAPVTIPPGDKAETPQHNAALRTSDGASRADCVRAHGHRSCRSLLCEKGSARRRWDVGSVPPQSKAR